MTKTVLTVNGLQNLRLKTPSWRTTSCKCSWPAWGTRWRHRHPWSRRWIRRRMRPWMALDGAWKGRWRRRNIMRSRSRNRRRKSWRKSSRRRPGGGCGGGCGQVGWRDEEEPKGGWKIKAPWASKPPSKSKAAWVRKTDRWGGQCWSDGWYRDREGTWWPWLSNDFDVFSIFFRVLRFYCFTLGFSMHGVLHAAHLVPILGLVPGERGNGHQGLGCWHARRRPAQAAAGGVVQNAPGSMFSGCTLSQSQGFPLSKLTRDCSMY